MSVIAFSKQFFLRLLILLGLINLAAFAAAALLGWQRSSVENGALENVQLVMLVVSLAAGAFAAIRSAGLLRLVMASWVAVMLLMIQREVDFSTFGTESWLFALHSMKLRLALWLPIVTALLVWAFPYRDFVPSRAAAIRWRHLWPVLLVGVLMLGSELAEQLIKTGDFREQRDVLGFLEELTELNGYCVVVAMAVAIAARVRRPATPAQVAARNDLDPAA